MHAKLTFLDPKGVLNAYQDLFTSVESAETRNLIMHIRATWKHFQNVKVNILVTFVSFSIQKHSS